MLNNNYRANIEAESISEIHYMFLLLYIFNTNYQYNAILR